MPRPEISFAAAPQGAALQHGQWRMRARLASGLARVERFLAEAGFDRAPWLVVPFGIGILCWFGLPTKALWLMLIGSMLALCGLAAVLMRDAGPYPHLRQAIIGVTLAVAFGAMLVWVKSELAGSSPIARPLVAEWSGKVLARTDQPAQDRVRLLMATREPGTGRAIRVRINVPTKHVGAEVTEGAHISVKARLMPPAPPMLPGGYDFARTAWFAGLSATGNALGPVQLRSPAPQQDHLRAMQRQLSAHVRSQVAGSPGALAAAFASGDRGGIAPADDAAMRDSGLTHLLSISGLHVSAVIAAIYLLAGRLFAAWPWLALRVRVPLLAAATGAGAGIAYTLLTGAEVPTVRSCIGAVLVLLAHVLGREPLSLRLVALGAFLVLLIWPEALLGPSFQMSFTAVLAIVALHGAAPVKALFAPAEQAFWLRPLKHLLMLLATGVVIELALLPIGLFHFHRAGVYGALANVLAIPLTTVVSMPLIAVALLFDLAGAGAPFWWLAGKSLELLLALAHWTAAMPGAVTAVPGNNLIAFLLAMAGTLWLALWSGRIRLWGLIPWLFGAGLLATAPVPDLLISRDGRHAGITTPHGDLLVLRAMREGYALDSMNEIAGMRGGVSTLDEWPGARCNGDFCAVALQREGRRWIVLMARGTDYVAERELAAACERADIVVASRSLPRSCRPRWLKADGHYLASSGGLALNLARQQVQSVRRGADEHGWQLTSPSLTAIR